MFEDGVSQTKVKGSTRQKKKKEKKKKEKDTSHGTLHSTFSWLRIKTPQISLHNFVVQFTLTLLVGAVTQLVGAAEGIAVGISINNN